MVDDGQLMDPTVPARRLDPSSSEPATQHSPGTLIADRYRLLEVLGAGGMGEVWRAEQTDLCQEVALKLLRDHAHSPELQQEIRARFKHEARLLASLNDPRIVQYLDHGETDDGTLFMAMEMLHGQTLESHLEAKGRLSAEEVLWILDEVAAGLESAHQQGLVHRDLKPGNIFLTDDHYQPRLRLLDFGIAKTLDPGDGTPRTKTGMFVGSPHYMAPEQFEGVPEPATDLYALGIIAWECLAGRRPFEGSIASIAGKHLMAEAPALPMELHIPEELSGLVMCLMEKVPGHRPANSQRLRKRIHHIRELIDPPRATPWTSPARALGLLTFFGLLLLGLVHALPHMGWLQPTAPLPAGMIMIPAGPFFMGCSPASDPGCARIQKVGDTVRLDAYAIDTYEVTVEAYAKCVASGECSSDGLLEPIMDGHPQPKEAKHCNWNNPKRQQHPINCISWFQAHAYCAARNARLPTEAEWEKAARGLDARRFPWGNQNFSHREANVADATARRKYRWRSASRTYSDLRAGTAPVGEMPRGVSPYGLYDTVGNVWEWTATELGPDRIFRGASFLDSPRQARITSRSAASGTTRAINVGFRCAK